MSSTENKKEDDKQEKETPRKVVMKFPFKKVVIHPLVLLSVVDHYNRVAQGNKHKRVVGILLGSIRGKALDVANSFAVPFDEEGKNVWFLDHEYLENMFAMFKKVNSRERIVGWYHTGPKLRSNDLQINELLLQYVKHPVLVIIDAKPKDVGLPTESYIAVEEIHDDGTMINKTFEHLPSEIGAEEAEEVGVEHLLRDIRNITAGTLSQQITQQVYGLKGLGMALVEIVEYLKKVNEGKLPKNNQILSKLQDIQNLLPPVTAPFVQSLKTTTNDHFMTIYLASIVRTGIALHNLLLNKLMNKDAEQQQNRKIAAQHLAKAAAEAQATANPKN
ncbi:hypothetical protein SNEBB_008703 [Seison nebaliae]|nr:hypothetical protein SNEBB_008703 [Seison nebaliae]